MARLRSVHETEILIAFHRSFTFSASLVVQCFFLLSFGLHCGTCISCQFSLMFFCLAKYSARRKISGYGSRHVSTTRQDMLLQMSEKEISKSMVLNKVLSLFSYILPPHICSLILQFSTFTSMSVSCNTISFPQSS